MTAKTLVAWAIEMRLALPKSFATARQTVQSTKPLRMMISVRMTVLSACYTSGTVMSIET